MIHLQTFWLVSVALMLTAFGVRVDPATAQTTYPFSANYDILATAKDLTPNQTSNKYLFQVQVLMPHMDCSKLIA